MTDTGQVPGEGLPENAGMVEQPSAPAHGAYTYLSEATAEDEDLLLLPGAQGAWGNEVPPPLPEPVVETVHEPGPHETAGRDSGNVDLSGIRLPHLTPPPVSVATPAAAAPSTHRRPLHMGPPTPDQSASPVRSLADRGPAGRPARQPGLSTTGPEYLDVPQLRETSPPGASPWGAPAPGTVQAPVHTEASPAETVVPTTEPGAYGAYDVDGAEGAHMTSAPEGGEAPYGGEAVQVPEGAAGSMGDVPGAPAPEPSAGGPQAGAESGSYVAEGLPVPEAGQEPEVAAVLDAGQLPEGPVIPEAGPVAEAPSVPEAESLSGVDAAPDAAQVLMTEAAPDAGLPEAGHPVEVDPAQDAGQGLVAVPALDDTELVPAVESAVPEVTPIAEDVVPETAHAPDQVSPEAPHAPDPAAEPAQSAPAPLPPESAVPFPAAPEAAQPLLPADVEPFAQDPHEQSVAEAHHTQGPQHATPHAPLSVVQPEMPDAETSDAQGMVVATPIDDAEVLLPPAVEDVAPAEPVDEQAPFETPADVPLEPLSEEEYLGEFVPVEGSVPTTPHLAPTPPHALRFPSEEHQDPQEQEPVVVVPAPREGDAEPMAAEPELQLVQHAEDLDTQAADLEESTAAVAETRESTGPAAPAYDDAEREAVLKVMRERRDIRNGFRSDPIPHEVLLRVLEAAHTAPSVGHSQPWDFVVIRSAETRRTMHELAMRQRDAYAKSLPKGRAKQFKELKIEAILDTPVNIVVTADPTRGGRHTLGRHTQPQMAPYSSALAVENLWLAARAEGLGVGWVSFFDEREMVRALGLPEHLEVVAYLCVGYVDEFPEEPELMQSGWSKRRPLSWVVHEETYGRRALPGEDPHDLLAETVAQIRPLDAKALGEAWERQKRMTKPPGALGMLEIISAQLSGLSRQCPPPIPEPAAVAIFAGDHGVHAQGVTPWPQEVTAQMVANFLGGGAVCNAFAGQVGAEVCVVDVGVATELPATPGLLPRKVRAGTSDMTTGPAMTREEAKQAIEVGIETARDLVAAGNKALLTGEMGIANTTASAALISVFTDTDPGEVTGRGTGINDETLARKTEVVRRAIELHQPDPADPIGVLAAVGGFEHAAMVGLLLGGASLRTPVILDGVSAGAAALVARAIAPEVLAACIAGHRSAEPGHVAALNKLGLRPLVDLDLRLGEGTGALLALPLVQSTARAMHEVATFDSAGVTEK
ncbi:nicotinate-nucleotide--dimethylbenzimidazole phosphoribosyltransferase [Streptomyces sp. GESEQ-35]|uniref:nicotinate-nucleotide--dimethylbenzimidazole phosphoribosyltransferase n=1 Tax=Streptomyces sp. GESEQ-35 TaxID=2812657 RepID=UPI001B3271C1|nr:nicotinate-nucleotide--dimethylbenzimidazole phosphoribosyltransferase [Streptomyces sp. GESEQ-35]